MQRASEEQRDRIVGIAGSLRSGSYNAARCCAASEECRRRDARARIDPAVFRSMTATWSGAGYRQRVAELKTSRRRRPLLLVSPEYNNSIPGTFKNRNRLDDAPSRHRPRIRTSPGRADRRVAEQLRTVLSQAPGCRCSHARMRPGSGSCLSAARAGCSIRGKLADDAIRQRCANTWKASSVVNAGA